MEIKECRFVVDLPYGVPGGPASPEPLTHEKHRLRFDPTTRLLRVEDRSAGRQVCFVPAEQIVYMVQE